MNEELRADDSNVKLPSIYKTDRKANRSVLPKDRYMPVNPLVWAPNDHQLEYPNDTKPLNDRTHTPRGATKAISLSRVFDKELWIPSRKHNDLFTGETVDKDIRRGKWVARVNRKKKRQAESKQMLANIKTSLLKDVSTERLKIVIDAKE